jgi:hypothetical protein
MLTHEYKRLYVMTTATGYTKLGVSLRPPRRTHELYLETKIRHKLYYMSQPTQHCWHIENELKKVLLEYRANSTLLYKEEYFTLPACFLVDLIQTVLEAHE